ncbi:MAG: DUF2130 domain-containing protein [Bacteroidetes bacterium]|nr:DUF2130 domain-containing protein [Bacteroidota bacterium]MBU1720410.1 DUF2130 domain-containing protein [Bacteroidota bacterium]
MESKSLINCPNCQHSFSLEQALSGDFEKLINSTVAEQKAKIEAEFQKKEAEYKEQIRESERIRQETDEKNKVERLALIEQGKKQVSLEFEEKLKMLEQDNKQKEEKIREQQRKELELIQKQKEIDERKAGLELEIEEKMKLRMEEFAQQQASIRKKAEEEAARKVREESAMQIQSMKEELEKQNGKVMELSKRELDLLKLQSELTEKQQLLEIESQKKMLEKQKEIEENITRREAEKHEMVKREYQKQIDDQKKLVEEMQRKAEQGSMQLQGEVQELALEELLRETFRQDIVSEVAKGVKGADCVLTVRNNSMRECGRIIFESKRTKAFSSSWIEKLKQDMIAGRADVAVIVTQALPDGIQGIGMKDGVWICSFQHVRGLVLALREGVMKIYMAQSANENKGDKMSSLYSYLTSEEFRQQLTNIVEGFMGLKAQIFKERASMERMWKEREKQIEKVLMSTTSMAGTLSGISEGAIGHVQALEIGSPDMIE